MHRSSKNVTNANSNGMKLSLTAYRSDHEIHTPEHRSDGYSAKNYFESVRKSLILEYRSEKFEVGRSCS